MQGHTQTMAISEYFDIEDIVVYDINRQTAELFAENMQAYVTGEIQIANTPEEAARGDAIVCVTQSKQKFVKNAWVQPGTILFPMGSYQECENEFILGVDKIIVDHVDQCLHRGALKELAEAEAIGKDDIFATIGEIAAGKKQAEFSQNERILCIPIGTGAMDVAIATIVLKRATEKKVGGSFTFV
jgi:ornithine cyclodeaminase/alanine dehydrogenase